MSSEMIGAIIMVGSFLLMIAVKFPIAYAMGLSSIFAMLFLHIPMQMVAQSIISGLNAFSLLAIPFFILAGEIMSAGGISKRLVRLSSALVGWIRGGLAMVNIVASMFFGGISGSSAADTASLGPILIPMMAEEGYDKDFATGITLASSVEGILIPPSHNMIIFSLAAGSVSIAKLFMAGMVPGILLGVFLMIFSYFVSVKRNYPKGERFALKELWLAFKSSIWGLLTVIIVILGVTSGLFTATESAAVAALYAFIVATLVYKELKIKDIGRVLKKALSTLSIVMIVIGTSSLFGWMLAYLRVPAMIVDGIHALTSNRILIIIIINLILLLLGMLMDMAAIILVATPVLLPLAVSVGIDPIHFGVIMMLNLGIGLLTPPVGNTLFIGSAISGIRVEKLAKSMIPIYITMLIVLLLINFIPDIVMTLPRLVK